MQTPKNNDLLLVIDMQNVYLPDQEWACPSSLKASANIRRIIDSGKPGQLLFTQFLAPQAPSGTWKTYNADYKDINENAWLCAYQDAFLPYLEKYPLAVKDTYSSLKCPSVLEAAKKADRLVLTGVVAECCVLATMMEAIDLGLPTIYLTDCCSGQSEENEERVCQIAQSFAPMHTLVMDTQTYLSESSSL